MSQKKAKKDAKRKAKLKAGRVAALQRRQNEMNDGFPAMLTDLDDGEPIQYFGYDRVFPETVPPYELPEEGLLCMISEVVPDNVEDIRNESGKHFEIGDWWVSANESDGTVRIRGPFSSEEEALEIGRQEFGVISYRGAPQFFSI